MDHLHARICSCSRVRDHSSPIRRVVVNDNDFQGYLRLPQDGLKSGGKILLFIPCRHDHGYFCCSVAACQGNGMPANASGGDHESDANCQSEESHGKTEKQKD
jgi:hypothetical protein